MPGPERASGEVVTPGDAEDLPTRRYSSSPPQVRPSRRGERLVQVAVFIVGTAIAAVRLGPQLVDAIPWAEDILIFVHDAGASRFGLEPLWNTYAGYLHVFPRLAAAFCRLFPLPWTATILLLICAAVQGFAAAFTWHVLRTLSVSRWAAVVATVPVAMVPLGVEVVLSLANVQWFLLYMSLLAVVWTPRGWPGRLLQAVLLVLTAVSSPFGALPVAALAVRGLVTRSRGALAVAGVGLVATTIQLLAMRAAPSRGLHLAFDPANLIGTYLRRVVADGMIGVGRNGGLTYAPSIKAGLACTAVVVLLAALGVWRFGRPAAVVMAALFGLSVVAFLAPSVLEGVAGTDPLFQGRYMVAPALLWLAMTAVALSAASRVTGVTRLAVRALCAVVVLGVLVAAVLSYPVRVDGREGVTPWLPQLTTDAASCAASPGATIVVLEVAPRGWTSHLTCSQILDW